MYLFAQHGILSIVAHNKKPDMLMVRSVARRDIEHYWPSAKIVRTDDGDYRFRTRLPRDEVAARIAQAVAAIDYPKVKPAVAKDRKHTYFTVWDTMMSCKMPEPRFVLEAFRVVAKVP